MNFLIVPSSLRTVPAHSAPCTSPSIPQPCVCVCVSHSVLSNSLRSHGLEPTRLLCPWDSPGKNTGVGCHFFLSPKRLMKVCKIKNDNRNKASLKSEEVLSS